ncbi:MAG: virginiamycin A acetyltransferase [Paracoccaceae bacterium]|jgi:virginiamycin A acetyltransferase
MPLPDPSRRYPVTLPDRSEHAGTVFLSQAIDHPDFQVGDYTYASDFDPSDNSAQHLAPYLFPGSAERLAIGKFCQIAHGVRFITSSADHAMDGLTNYPFPIFDPEKMTSYQPDTRDTIIGHDVWLGYGALVLPGAQIGNGVIVGAGAVVRGQIPDYSIVTGNPTQVTRPPFAQSDITRLQQLEWWHWPQSNITTALPALLSGDIAALERAAP